ncbi:MAG: class II aldolase/adducin family protein [Dethiobacter sp.]|jgi:L-fuculose-phosphate aldolase|nr:class II aldolase/adducin family protein [Dethiobacter sp.]
MAGIRTEIINTTQIMCSDKLVLGTWGNVSAREGQEKMWITPSGMNYDSLQEEDLVLLDLQGLIHSGRWKPSSEWRLHAAIYRARPECSAIVHTHSPHATAFAIARQNIPPVVEDLVEVVGGSVEVAAYTLPGTWELAENCVRGLGERNAVLLANHGLVGVGSTLPEALKVCQIVEKTAQAVLLARLLGPVVELCEEDIRKMRNFYLNSYGPKLTGEEV